MTDDGTYVITCSRDESNELITVECEALTGGKPNQWGIARGSAELVGQGAFLKLGVQMLAHANGVEQLAIRVAELGLCEDGFRIEWLDAGGRQHARLEAIIAMADQIGGKPNLSEPRHRFLLIASEGGISFGRIVAEANRSYREHDGKPYRTSSSLPTQLARGLVNLAAPYADKIVDPCCGT